MAPNINTEITQRTCWSAPTSLQVTFLNVLTQFPGHRRCDHYRYVVMMLQCGREYGVAMTALRPPITGD